MINTNGQFWLCISFPFMLMCLACVVWNTQYNNEYAFTAVQQLFTSGVERRFNHRRERLAEKCLEFGLDEPDIDVGYEPYAERFIVDKTDRLIWCPVFKAASTSWLYNLNILAGHTAEELRATNRGPLEIARDKYWKLPLREIWELQSTSITFLITRHPFERIASGFCDKLATPNPWFANRLGLDIIINYRNASEVSLSEEYPTFREFVHWLTDRAERYEHINEHFESINTFCTPCLIDFDYILKMETLRDDELFLIEKAGLTGVISPRIENQSKCGNVTDYLRSYYSQLTKYDLERLWQYYKYDLELFGYSIESYYEMVKDGK